MHKNTSFDSDSDKNKDSVQRTKIYIDINPEEVRTINKLLTGHDLSPFLLAKMKLVESGLCQICQTQNTGRHMVFTCKKYETNRRDITFDRLKERWKQKSGYEIKKITTFMKENQIEI